MPSNNGARWQIGEVLGLVDDEDDIVEGLTSRVLGTDGNSECCSPKTATSCPSAFPGPTYFVTRGGPGEPFQLRQNNSFISIPT